METIKWEAVLHCTEEAVSGAASDLAMGACPSEHFAELVKHIIGFGTSSLAALA
jgi:hypothetical protein